MASLEGTILALCIQSLMVHAARAALKSRDTVTSTLTELRDPQIMHNYNPVQCNALQNCYNLFYPKLLARYTTPVPPISALINVQ